MTRTALTLTLFAGLAAWATAQSTPRTTADDLRLLRTNRALLKDLIDHGLKLSDAGSPLDRATECRRTAATLAAELRAASADTTTDPERVAELSDHLTALVQEGLVPNYDEARVQIRPGSPDYPKLKELHDLSKQDLDQTQKAIPTSGKLGQSRKVAEARRKLADAGKLLAAPE